MKTYEMQGGTANLYLNDDGLQLLNPQEAQRRQAFYKQYDIGYVARPPHEHRRYVRAGKFKKASNMVSVLACLFAHLEIDNIEPCAEFVLSTRATTGQSRSKRKLE